MSKFTNLLNSIQSLAPLNESVTIPLDNLEIPLKLADKKAIQIIEMLSTDEELSNPTVKDISEILNFAKWWLEFLQILEYNAKKETTYGKK